MNSPPPPGKPQTPLEQALALHRAGDHEGAMECYVAILQQNPGNTDALHYVAMIAIQQGQFAEGIRVIERALAVGKPQARTLNLLGQAHLRLGQDADALKAFTRAIEADAGFVDAHGNRATLLAEMGRLEEAVSDFDNALRLRPDNAEDLCNRAGVLLDLGRIDEAIAGFDRAIVLMPDLTPAWFNRGNALMRLGRAAEALRDYDHTLALVPRMAGAHSQRGLALKELGRIDEARASIERAIALDPKLAEAHLNRGNIAFELGQLDEAQQHYARALQIQSDLPEAIHSRALACLCQGDWETGFRLYEHRDKLKTPSYSALPYPRWTGATEHGERLVLLCEQGLGDMIQFCRFAPVLAKRGIDVTLLAPDTMVRLLSTLDGVTVARHADAPATNGKPVRWLPLMSVPGTLGLRPDSVPAAVPYLAAEPTRIETWSAWLGSDGFKIGINWNAGSGLGRGWFARRRDIMLAAFAPLASLPGVRLINLQKGPAAQQIATVAFRDRIEIPDTDLGPAADNFVDTAALMKNLDLIVSCDTSVPHLAGALARPVFTALPMVADWRWGRHGETTPWYPTMRLFRQSRPDDWRDVFERIAAAVGEMISAQKR